MRARRTISWVIRWGGLAVCVALLALGAFHIRWRAAIGIRGGAFVGVDEGSINIWFVKPPATFGSVRIKLWHIERERAWRWLPDWRSGPVMKAVSVPLWMPLVFTAAGTTSVWRIHRRRSRPGYCPKCGYDLTGLAGGVCPECGHARETRRLMPNSEPPVS